MADINSNVQDDSVLLHLAVIEENEDVVTFLLKHGIPANSRAINRLLALEFISDAEHKKHVENIQCQDAQGNDAPLLIDQVTEKKTTTALHLVARTNNKAIAERLVISGADIDAEMEGGETPLLIAVLYNRPNLVEFFFNRGANINAKTIWGYTPLHYAVKLAQKSIIELLLKHGAQVNAASAEGMTPLHIAAEAGQKDIVITLLKHDAGMELKTKSGATALHYAAVMGHTEIIEIILGNGADINMIMKQGGLDLSPFKWVTEAEQTKTWELISKYTAKMSLVSWYNSMVMKLYKRSKDRKNTMIQAEAVQRQS